jgi:DNA-binding PadR family transcriptional regulator
MMSPSVPDLGRFAKPAVGVLAALAAGPRSSDAIAADVESRTRSRIGPATLIGSLARLECLGLIAGLEAGAGLRRYRITELGESYLLAIGTPPRPFAQAARVRLEGGLR